MKAEMNLEADIAVEDESSIQEGFRAKSIGLIAFLFVLMYLYISLNGPDSMNLLLPALQSTFGWAPPDVAVRLGIIRLIAIVVMFVLGTLFIKVGIKKLLVPCTILNGLLVVAMANVSSLDQFVWINIAIGIVSPAATVALGAITANWFVRTRGRVLGIITIAFPFSTATFTLIGTKWIEALGYSSFYTTVGIFMALIGVAGYWLMSDTPEEHNMSPDGIPFSEKEKADIKIRESFQSAWTVIRILTSKEIWAYTLAWSLAGLVLGSIMSQMIPVFTSSGLSINKALTMMSVGALAGIPLSYVWGYLDDKIGTPNTSIAFVFVLVTGAIGMAYGSADNILPYYLAVVCIALGSAGYPNLQPSSLAYIVGRREFMNVQRYFNLIYAIFFSIMVAYVPVMYAKFGSYKPVFLSLIVFIVIAVIALMFTRKTFDPERQKFIEEGQSH